MKKLLSIPAVAAVASFASETTGPAWWPTTDPSFDGVLSKAAPVALAAVVAIAGIRVAIKLLNRAAGK